MVGCAKRVQQHLSLLRVRTKYGLGMACRVVFARHTHTGDSDKPRRPLHERDSSMMYVMMLSHDDPDMRYSSSQ